MTATLSPPAGSRRAAPVATTAVIAAIGCGLLAARPALVSMSSRPAAVLVCLFSLLLIVGLSMRIPPETRVTGARHHFVMTTALGVVAFAVGRVLIGGHAPITITLWSLAANSLAAVAEEVWFRRVCFGVLAPAGTAFAIVASSALFAVVHVSTYGVSVLPLDVAAGALLGWQRATTGSWRAPALTHVLANVLVLL
ncbi:MAG TPA: CPBP family intramembrane glutamic endopeptidase [Acidimicrobiia bacterium]|nr:CPBP family intramembrane glutamic endopeptidase [Acidimicrobiia bacterium]